MKNLVFGSVLIFLALSIIYTASVYLDSITGRIIERSPYLSKVGFSRVSVSVDKDHIYLTSGCEQLTMSTTNQQTYSIAGGLGNIETPRPTSHDLMRDIFDLYDIRVLMVKVDSYRDRTYYARLLLRQGNKILNLDSRPSDAIAVAVRSGAPVYVRNEVMERLGRRIC